MQKPFLILVRMEEYYKNLKVKVIDIEAGKFISLMNERDAKEIGVLPLERVEITNPRTKKSTHTVVDISTTMVSRNNIGIFRDVQKELGIKSNDHVAVKPAGKPESVAYIKRKMGGDRLNKDHIKAIVDDITNNKLSDIELTAFMSAVYMMGFDIEETVAMTRALVLDGKQLNINASLVVDKHSIGGTNGRVTMIVVPIVAAAGYYIPKTSSKAITSCCGTADAMEVLANVDLSINEMKQITEKIGGIIAWGGNVELAPADDKIIKIEHPLSLDPEGQVVASVMAKKASAGSKFVVIDLPIGPQVKIKTRERAESMAMKFIEVGKRFGIKVECILTDGSEPSGLAFGPALEAKYVMEILEGQKFDNLAQKSCEIAGAVFEIAGKTKKGNGYAEAKEILSSGKALHKMKEIIKAQGGRVFSSSEIKTAEFFEHVKSVEKGKIRGINVRNLTQIARIAGAPADKKAGIMLKKKIGEDIINGETVYDLFAENKRKMKAALAYAQKNNPIEIEKIVFGKYR
jgi:AMP phosphorylase